MALFVLAGCGAMGGPFGDRGWVPQGPGEVPEPRAQRMSPRATPATAAGSAARPAAPALTSAGGYTQAARYGDLLFLSGQIAMDGTGEWKGGDATAQTRQVMENIKTILETHRLTVANIVSVTVYLKDLKDFRAMDEVYETYFRGNLPARSVVEVSRLPREALVEISVIAGR